MPSLAEHQSAKYTKLLLLGDAKCLAGDTIVKVTRGSSIGKAKTLRQLYYSSEHRLYDPALETYLLCDLGGYVGLNLMEGIVFSGRKDTIIISTTYGSIQASYDHMFLTESGWTRAEDLYVGQNVSHWSHGPGKKAYPQRRMVYSVRFHPNAHQHNIGEYGNYKRIPFARAVIEASMNNLSVEEFIDIIRNKPLMALSLKYIPKEWDVHHKDRDRTNDSISNLVAMPEAEHVDEHTEDRNRTSKATTFEKITSIVKGGFVDTYDVVMADPYNNFIANGFIVHNSGKTTSLASLVADGWILRILDLDNLLDGLRDRIVSECPQFLRNVEFRTLRDRYKTGPTGPMLDGPAKAFIESMKMLDRWKYDNVDLGSPKDWGDKVILVIDGLTRLCDAAYAYHVSIAPPKQDGRAIFFDAQKAVEMVLANLTSERFATNVIVVCHGSYQELPDGTTKIFPSGIGQKLSPKIPSYFPVYVRYRNNAGKRDIQIKSDVMIDLAMPRLGAFEGKTLPVETGLATIFKTLRGEVTTQQERPKSVILQRRK